MEMDAILSIYWTDGKRRGQTRSMRNVLPYLRLRILPLVFAGLLVAAPRLGADEPGYDSFGQSPLTAYLNRDCLPPVGHVPLPRGERLGWVSQVDRHVVPIIHVECTGIGAE